MAEKLADGLAAEYRKGKGIFIPRLVGEAVLAALAAGKNVTFDALMAEFEARRLAMLAEGEPATALGRIEIEEVISCLQGLRKT